MSRVLWMAGPLLAANLLAAAGPPGLSAGQGIASGGSVQGTVADPSGLAIPGAEVTLSNTISGFNQEFKSDAAGAFRFGNVPANEYVLKISSPGFQPFQKQLSIRTHVPAKVDAVLALAASVETINVEASPNMVENVPSAHTDVDRNLMVNLPTSSTGQGLSDAITLTSGGVVADSNGFFHPQGDHGETTYVVDGQTISDQQNKNFSTQLPPNAFQSLELVSGAPSAEFGDKTSLIVNATTRSALGQKPSASLLLTYGSFGTASEEATLGLGGSKWGNFLVFNANRSGRFLDSPEFTPFHDIGNNGTIFDRLDGQPTNRDQLHLNIFAARNWFQIPNAYDQLSQDQRQQARTLSFALGYQHTFTPQLLLSINPFVRQDRVNYYPSRDAFDDTPASLSQDRHLTNLGTKIDLAYVKGIHNFKAGTEITQERLIENFTLGITDPTFNPPCLFPDGSAVLSPVPFQPGACENRGFVSNPGFSPSLFRFDLTRAGSPFRFHEAGNINEQTVYAQDQITLQGLTLSLGLRFDNYNGLSQDKLLQPRVGASYMIKQTGTVIRGSYTRSMETPYNENLLLSSSTGPGGLAFQQPGFFGAQALRPGHRNQFGVGLQQAIHKFVQVDASYFWKYTQGAFDFDTLFNTPLSFPIEWRQSKIDGVSVKISTVNLRGFQAYTTFGHTRARFFGPEVGGLVFNSPIDNGVFRIDHDQEFQQTTFLRYQYKKDGPWAAFTWRYDSGEVAGSVTNLADALALTAAQQAAIGFFCGSQVAALGQPITSCSGNYGARNIVIPAEGTYNPDHNPPRIASRHLFDVSLGTDNLFHKEKVKTTLKLTAINITNQASLYNFLSTFSGTHWVTPRTYQVSLGWVY